MNEINKESPTNAELEVLEILWLKKKATVREVYDIISENKECVYTTTLKIMQKMMAKGLIGRSEDSLKHEYFPLIEESKLRNSYVNEIINRFFKGSSSKLALHALGQSSGEDNLEDVVKLINELKPKK